MTARSCRRSSAASCSRIAARLRDGRRRRIARRQRGAAAPLVVVHGGGKEIDAALKVAGIEKRQVDGLRITDEPTLDVVVSVLAGAVNTRLVAALNDRRRRRRRADRRRRERADCRQPRRRTGRSTAASSISGASAFRASRADMRVLQTLLAESASCRSIACIGLGRDGRLFNVNADTFAGHLAARLGARRLVIAGTTPGVLDADGATVPTLGRRRDRAAGRRTARRRPA